MQKILSLLLLALALCGGCATRYNLTLTNGEVVTSKGKPTYDEQKAGYFYKDINGGRHFVFASKVREVAPASMADKNGSQFIK
jgi:hypothetical protein